MLRGRWAALAGQQWDWRKLYFPYWLDRLGISGSRAFCAGDECAANAAQWAAASAPAAGKFGQPPGRPLAKRAGAGHARPRPG